LFQPVEFDGEQRCGRNVERFHSLMRVFALFLFFTQTFIAQTPRDYELLNKINDEPHYMEIGRQKKRVRIATYQVTDRDLERIHDQPPATREQVSLRRGVLDANSSN
jgi:predicted ATPase